MTMCKQEDKLGHNRRNPRATQGDSAQKEPRQVDDSMAVITRAQKRNQKKKRAIVADKEHQSGAISHRIHIRKPSECIELELDDEVLGSQFEKKLFTESKTKPNLKEMD